MTKAQCSEGGFRGGALGEAFLAEPVEIDPLLPIDRHCSVSF